MTFLCFLVGLAVVNTILGGCSGGLNVLLLNRSVALCHSATKISFMYSFSRNCAASVLKIPHSYVCERFIYSEDESTYLAAAKQIDRSWKYINLSQIYECRNWETEHSSSVLEIRRLHQCTVSFLGIHKWKPDIYIGFSPYNLTQKYIRKQYGRIAFGLALAQAVHFICLQVQPARLKVVCCVSKHGADSKRSQLCYFFISILFQVCSKAAMGLQHYTEWSTNRWIEDLRLKKHSVTKRTNLRLI